MSIFPINLRDFGVMLGKTFGIIGLSMAVLALGFFIREEYVLHYWSKADGVVISSRVAESRTADDIQTCSLIEDVSFSLQGKEFSSEIGGNSYTGNCFKIRQEAAQAVNSHVEVLHDPGDPQSFYIKDALTGDFFLNSYLLAVIATIFGFVGLIIYKVGKWIQRQIRLPKVGGRIKPTSLSLRKKLSPGRQPWPHCKINDEP